MCDVGYFCAIFSLPRPLCSRVRPDVRDRRQTSDRRQTKASLNVSALWGGGIIIVCRPQHCLYHLLHPVRSLHNLRDHGHSSSLPDYSINIGVAN